MQNTVLSTDNRNSFPLVCLGHHSVATITSMTLHTMNCPSYQCPLRGSSPVSLAATQQPESRMDPSLDSGQERYNSLEEPQGNGRTSVCQQNIMQVHSFHRESMSTAMLGWQGGINVFKHPLSVCNPQLFMDPRSCSATCPSRKPGVPGRGSSCRLCTELQERAFCQKVDVRDVVPLAQHQSLQSPPSSPS